jgi:hypothetical protein
VLRVYPPCRYVRAWFTRHPRIALELVLDLKTKRKRIIQWARNKKTKPQAKAKVKSITKGGGKIGPLGVSQSVTDPA